MMHQLLTVLMAVHNNKKHVELAVQSILQQTYGHFEFLIIDDCSSDGSVEIIRKMYDPRIRIERNTVQMGLTRSLNRGLSLANGKYIARIDADDCAYPSRLEKQLIFLTKNPTCGLVGSWFRVIDKDGDQIAVIKTPEADDHIRAALRLGNAFAHSAVMFPRHCSEKVNNYREFFQYAQDYDLFLRLAAEFKVNNIPEILVDWRIHLDSSSARFKILQDLYADLARECAFSNINLPKDQNKWLKPYMGSRLRRSRTEAIGYFKWAANVFYTWTGYKKRIRTCGRLLGRSFLANPATFTKLFVPALMNASKRLLIAQKQ